MPGPRFLDGEEVSLHTIEREDVEWMNEVANDSRVWRTALGSRPYNREQGEEFFEEFVSGEESVTLLLCAGGDPVGYIAMADHDPESGTAELGYWLAPDAWGNGYATDAARRFVAYGFEQRNLHKWTAKVVGTNEASMRVLEKVGFSEEGVHRENWPLDGAYRDTHWFGLLREEWEGEGT